MFTKFIGNCMTASSLMILVLTLPVIAQEALSPLEKAVLCKGKKSGNTIIKAMIKDGSLSRHGYMMDYSISYFPLKSITVFGGKLLTVSSDNIDNTGGRHVGCCPNNTFSVLVENLNLKVIQHLAGSDERVFVDAESDGIEYFKDAMKNEMEDSDKKKAIPKWLASVNKANVVQIECKLDY